MSTIDEARQDESPSGQPPVAPSPGPHGNGPASVGFVVALAGAIVVLLPTVGAISWVLSPLGLVLSILGVRIAARRQVGRAAAWTGVLLALFGLVMCTVTTPSFMAGINASSSRPATSPTQSYGTPSYSYPSYTTPYYAPPS
ncbi:hypothetical protein ACQPX6_15355 [Actinomycetospora sp. CA-101289]|uniref:hypothetical protein n=1 Tax=Actinomycetospora sp. CA-101289 TaxID=3239893 RepID=UPI003D993939